MDLSVSHTPRKPVESGVARSPQLSSESLSSPPRSSPEASPSVHVANEGISISTPSTSSSITTTTTTSASGALVLGVQPEKPPRRKPRRKPKDPVGNTAGVEAPKLKRTRKPKDPNAPPAQRRKKNNAPVKTNAPGADQKAISATPIQSPSSELTSLHSGPKLSSQVGKNEESKLPFKSLLNDDPPPQSQLHSQDPIVRTSGQKYDPVRPSNYDPVRETVNNQSTHNTSKELAKNSNTISYPSAPPSISGLVDSKSQSSFPASSAAPPSFFNQNIPKLPLCSSPSVPASLTYNTLDSRSNLNLAEISKPITSTAVSKKSEPAANHLSSKKPETVTNPSSTKKSESTANSSTKKSESVNNTLSTKKCESVANSSTKKSESVNNTLPTKKSESMTNSLSKKTESIANSSSLSKKSDSVANSSNKKSNINVTGPSASPKPIKSRYLKDTNENINPIPPPLPGSVNEPNDGTEYRAPTVILRIPMNGEVNKYVNFTRLAEQQYGWDALHPRLAAQRDRLARVAAAGAALERNGTNKDSGDEMSLDSEAEGSNVEMGGMSDGRPGSDFIKKVPKKRKMREDEYDKDDGFVDDTELLWEEQAAASNDGFFVYSGPLIPEGEKAALDAKADGATKRGRGRGSRGGAARGPRGGAANANTAARNTLPATGPGSRGGSTARKPRVTKAERARMEQEKLDREKSGLASTSQSIENIIPHTGVPPEGSLPMILSQ